MIVPVMAISNLVLTQQIYSEETNGAHAHYRKPVPLISARCYWLNYFTWPLIQRRAPAWTTVTKKSLRSSLRLQFPLKVIKHFFSQGAVNLKRQCKG